MHTALSKVGHRPWPIPSIERKTMLDTHGIALHGAPLLHFARRIDVIVWNGERVG